MLVCTYSSNNGVCFSQNAAPLAILFPVYCLIPERYQKQQQLWILFYPNFYCSRLLKSRSFLNNHQFLFLEGLFEYSQRNVSFCHFNWKLTIQGLMKVHVICSVSINELDRWNSILINTGKICIYQMYWAHQIFFLQFMLLSVPWKTTLNQTFPNYFC